MFFFDFAVFWCTPETVKTRRCSPEPSPRQVCFVQGIRMLVCELFKKQKQLCFSINLKFIKEIELNQALNPCKCYVYAHIEIVATFLVVNSFGFLVITRHHEGVKRPY